MNKFEKMKIRGWVCSFFIVLPRKPELRFHAPCSVGVTDVGRRCEDGRDDEMLRHLNKYFLEVSSYIFGFC